MGEIEVYKSDHPAKRINARGFVGIFLSFGIAFILCLAVFYFAGILPGGNSIAWNTDTIEQSASFGALMARHIKQGGDLYYTWETSLGQNTALINVGVYGPSLLFYLLVPDVYLATLLGIMLKVSLTSMFFYVFLSYGLCWKSRWNIFWGLCYAFCGFMMEYMMAAGLLDGLYMLPLIMWALLRSYRKKKYALLCVVYFLSFVTEVYMAFLTGIFSAGAILVYIYLKEKKFFSRDNFLFMARYAVSVVSAVLMSMILLCPAISCVLLYGGYASEQSMVHISFGDLLYSFFFGRPTSLKTNIPFLYCGLPVIMSLPVYFFNRMISRKERIVSAVVLGSLLLTVFITPVYMFLHLFRRPDGFTARYAFVYVFAFVVIAARASFKGKEMLEKMPAVRIVLFDVILILAAAGIILLHDNAGEIADGKGVSFALAGNLILLPLWGMILWSISRFGKSRIPTVLAYGLLCLELFAQSFFNVREMGLLDPAWIKDKEEQMQEFMAALNDSRQNDKEPYRAYVAAYPGENQSAWYGYMGIGQFASSHYENVNTFMGKLGNFVSDAAYSQEGATDLSDMLLAVRYRGRLTDMKEDGGPGFETYEMALPIGYMCSDKVLEEVVYNGNPFDYQNAVVSAMCGESIEVYKSAEIYAFEENGLYFSETEDGYSIQNNADTEYGDILFAIPDEGYEHAYAYFRIFPYTGELEEHIIPSDMATEIALFSVDDRKGNGSRFNLVSEDSIIEMTKDGNAFVLRLADYDSANKSFDYYDHLFYYQDDNTLKKAFEQLSENGWFVEKWKDTAVSAKVKASAERPVLFTSIPCDKGWKVYVDGVESTVNTVFDGTFIALRLSEGEHEIVFEYETPGKAEGELLFLAGLLIFLIMLLFENHRKSLKKQGLSDNKHS